MSLPTIEVSQPRQQLPSNDKNNGETGRRVTEVTVDELLQLEQLKLDQIGNRPEGDSKANEELEVTVKVTDNLSVNLKCNADVTPVDLLTRLVTEIRELTSQINSTSLQAKLMVPQEPDNNNLKQETDQVSNALNHISTVKELLMKQQVAVPTLKLELSPRPNTANGAGDGKDAKPNTSDGTVAGKDASRKTANGTSDNTVAGKDSARGDASTYGDRVLTVPTGSVSSDGLTPRKKDMTPRPAEERPSLVAYMNTLLKLNERAAISSEDKKIAKKYKRPKRDKKSNTSSANKKTSRTMRSTRTGGWVQTRPAGLLPQLNNNYYSNHNSIDLSSSPKEKSATLRGKPPSPEDDQRWTSTSPRSSTPPDEGKIATTRQTSNKSRAVTATPRMGNFLSVERQSLLSQSKFLQTSESELAREKLPTQVQKRHSVQVKITCRLPENKVIEERFDVETKIKKVKLRIYDLAIKAIETLEPIENYVLEFTDTKIYVLKENVTLKSLGIIDTQRSEYLSLVPRSEALEVKSITYKLNTILGNVVPAWDAKESEVTDFRKKIARNSPSTVFSNVPLALLTDAPIPFDFPKKVFVRFRLPDLTTKTIECDSQTNLQTLMRKVAELTARQTQRQIAINDHVIKLCGRAQFILEDVGIHKIEYVRNAIERRKRIEFHLVPLALLFEWLHYRAKANQGEFSRAAKRTVIRRIQTVESESDEESDPSDKTNLDEGLLLSTTVLSGTLQQEDRASSDPTELAIESDLSPLSTSPRLSVVAPEVEPAVKDYSPRTHARRSARAARILDSSAMKAAIKAQLSSERSRRTSYSMPRLSHDHAESEETSASPNNTNIPLKTPGFAEPSQLVHTTSKAQLNIPDTLRCQDFSLPFSVRVVGISRLVINEKFARTLRSRETGVAWIEVVTVHRGHQLTNPVKTPIIPLTTDPQWQVDLAIGPALRRLPRETRLLLTLWGARAGVEGSQMVLGWTALPLFDFRGVMVRGEFTRYMRIDDTVSPIGPVSDSVDARLKGVNKLDLLFDDWGHDMYNVSPLPKVLNFDNIGKPSSHTIHQLQRILQTDTLWSPAPRDKHLLWHYRYAILKEIPQLLNKLLLCIDWTNRTVLEEIYSLLDVWPTLDPLDALELLDAKFSDTRVREYAVKCLHKFSDEELKLYLLQLMQVIKYEPHHYSALAQFLLDRACRSEVTLGVPFFWYLHAEVDSEYRERFALIIEAFLMHCSDRQREEIFKQLEVVKKFKEISIDVKDFPKDKRRDELVKRLKMLILPTDFQLPLDPTIIVKGIDVEGCRVFDSAQAPLMLALVQEDPCADPFPVIFKQGDDLRQDILTIQVLTIMDKLWKQNGLDLHLTRYQVLSTSSDVGMIQVVTNAMTACKIQKSQGGALTGALKNSPLVNWIQEQNPNPQDFERAVDNFILSCAGYSVATYVLGVGDRHSDNIMVDRYGHFFHIDFGHFLGNFKYFGLMNRDKAPFAFPPEFAAVMGNKDGEKFKCFVELCCRAYNIVRANANLFLNLFAMMLSTGIAELRSEDDLLYLKGTMALHLTDEEAAELFRSLVYESLNTTATRINFLFHMWAH